MIRIKKVRARKGLRRYNNVGCPLTRHQSYKCFRACVPGQDDRGPCGRVAPHSTLSQVQLAILNHRRRAA